MCVRRNTYLDEKMIIMELYKKLYNDNILDPIRELSSYLIMIGLIMFVIETLRKIWHISYLKCLILLSLYIKPPRFNTLDILKKDWAMAIKINSRIWVEVQNTIEPTHYEDEILGFGL